MRVVGGGSGRGEWASVCKLYKHNKTLSKKINVASIHKFNVHTILYFVHPSKASITGLLIVELMLEEQHFEHIL